MDGFSIRKTLPRRRLWPRVMGLVLLLAGAFPLLWPVSVRSSHRQAVLEQRAAAMHQARSELEQAEEAVRQAWDQPSVVDVYNARPDRFNLMELRVEARAVEQPPYRADKLELARWCDTWDGPGRNCERGEESISKAEAAIIVFAHEHGEVPTQSFTAILAVEEKAVRWAAQESLDEAEAALYAPIEPVAGATGRWASTLLLLVAAALVAVRTSRFRPGIEIAVGQHGVRYGDTHVPVGEILTCVARDHVLLIGTTEDSLVWGPFEADRSELETVAGHIREVMLTPQQRAAEERARRKIEGWHGSVEARSRD
jgi:hypothetical protein